MRKTQYFRRPSCNPFFSISKRKFYPAYRAISTSPLPINVIHNFIGKSIHTRKVVIMTPSQTISNSQKVSIKTNQSKVRQFPVRFVCSILCLGIGFWLAESSWWPRLWSTHCKCDSASLIASCCYECQGWCILWAGFLFGVLRELQASKAGKENGAGGSAVLPPSTSQLATRSSAAKTHHKLVSLLTC